MTTIIIFLAAIILMVLAIARWKIHPFLAIIATALVLAVALGLPLSDIPDVVGKGFSSIFSGIGLVIIFGTLVGAVLETTGAAVAMARAIERTIGRRHPRLAIMLIGWIVSIPVFCDSGFVLVSPIAHSLARRRNLAPAALMLALGAGLFASHVFIPPTPGPVAAAGMMGLEDDLLLIIALGIAFSLQSLIPAYFFSGLAGSKINVEHNEPANEPVDAEKRHPGGTASFMPIIVPVILMAAGSMVPWLGLPQPVAAVITFLGRPVIALMVAFLCSLPLLFMAGKAGEFYDITQRALMTAGPIIFITAAGSVLGNVIIETGFIDIIKQGSNTLSALGMFFPFLIAAILKSAQGSSTVAITTTASIMGVLGNDSSLLHALGYTTPLQAGLVVMAIGAGAMTVSHANDSYFWVVTGFGGMKATDGYRYFTLMTLIMGITAITAIATTAWIIT